MTSAQRLFRHLLLGWLLATSVAASPGMARELTPQERMEIASAREHMLLTKRSLLLETEAGLADPIWVGEDHNDVRILPGLPGAAYIARWGSLMALLRRAGNTEAFDRFRKPPDHAVLFDAIANAIDPAKDTADTWSDKRSAELAEKIRKASPHVRRRVLQGLEAEIEKARAEFFEAKAERDALLSGVESGAEGIVAKIEKGPHNCRKGGKIGKKFVICDIRYSLKNATGAEIKWTEGVWETALDSGKGMDRRKVGYKYRTIKAGKTEAKSVWCIVPKDWASSTWSAWGSGRHRDSRNASEFSWRLEVTCQ